MRSESGSKTSRRWEPERSRHEAQSPAAKLPEGDPVFFLLATVPQLDVRRFYAPYEAETRGAPPCDPAMMACLWLYASCVGVFASRQMALACERHLAFMALVGQERPDFRTISDVRTQHLEACTEVFVQVVRLAGEAGLVKLGNVSTDGTTIQGNASRHKAMSYGDMQKAVERVREEIEALVTAAYQQDAAEDAALGSRRGDALPAALARRAQRLATIEAMRKPVSMRHVRSSWPVTSLTPPTTRSRPSPWPRRRGRAPHTAFQESAFHLAACCTAGVISFPFPACPREGSHGAFPALLRLLRPAER